MTTGKLNPARPSGINSNTIITEKSFSSSGPVFVFFIYFFCFIVVVLAHMMVGWSVERKETGGGGDGGTERFFFFNVSFCIAVQLENAFLGKMWSWLQLP